MNCPNVLGMMFVSVCFLGESANAQDCRPLTPEKRATLASWVHRKFGVSPSIQITVDAAEEVGDCYRRIRFVDLDRREFETTLYLTPDTRFLLPELNDTAVDPRVAERRRELEFGRDLENAQKSPVLGDANAPVTIVVFSDFECPYCREFGSTLKDVVARDNGVKIVFRNLPLRQHRWARLAAEAGACVGLQKRVAFWNFHDFVFSKQQELTRENVLELVSGHLGSLPEVKIDEFRECLVNGQGSRLVQADMLAAARYKVSGTPTVFVNGRIAVGDLTTQHLLTLVRESAWEGGTVENLTQSSSFPKDPQ